MSMGLESVKAFPPFIKSTLLFHEDIHILTAVISIASIQGIQRYEIDARLTFGAVFVHEVNQSRRDVQVATMTSSCINKADAG